MVSDQDFRAVMGRFATGVTVVTTLDGQTPVGLTVNAFASLSLDPPLVMIAIDRRSHLHTAIPHAGFFAASILSVGQADLSRRFAGQTSDRSDRFHGVAWRSEATGAPVLEGALAWADCRVEAAYPGGDHSIIVGRIIALDARPGEPLVYYRGGYGQFDALVNTPLRKIAP